MAGPGRLELRGLIGVRPARVPARSGAGLAVLVLRVGCAALLAWIGYIHLHLWQLGYKDIHIDGPMFLLDAIAGFVLAAVVLAWPRALSALAAAAYSAGTLGALLIALTVGLFGFHEFWSAAYVGLAVVVEVITVLAGAALAVLLARHARAR